MSESRELRDQSECSASVRLHSFSIKSFPRICVGDLGIETSLRKSLNNGTMEFVFSETTIRHVRKGNLPGARLRLQSNPVSLGGKEGNLGATVSSVFDFGRMAFEDISVKLEKAFGDGTATTDKPNQSSLRMTATWSPNNNNAITIEEEFEIDSSDVVSAKYDFATDEAVFTYERFFLDTWSASASYNVRSDSTEFKATKTFRSDENHEQGVLSLVYCPRNEIATICYSQRPWSVHLAAGMGSVAVPMPAVQSLQMQYSHTFDI